MMLDTNVRLVVPVNVTEWGDFVSLLLYIGPSLVCGIFLLDSPLMKGVLSKRDEVAAYFAEWLFPPPPLPQSLLPYTLQ